MATVRFVGFPEVRAEVGESLLDAAARAQVPLGGACGGVSACSTCHVYVQSGAEALADEDDAEADALDKAFDVRPTSRLGCRARVACDGTIRVELSRESIEAYENEHPRERGKYTRPRATGR
jgi:2Fe-2S ferredoxin